MADDSEFMIQKPDSKESGFFIDFITKEHKKGYIPENRLPFNTTLNYLREPFSGRYPSLLILPCHGKYSSYFNGTIPLILYGSEISSPIDGKFSAVKEYIPFLFTINDILNGIERFFDPFYFPFHEGWIRIESRCIDSSHGRCSLTRVEGLLLKAFLNKENFFLTHKELRRISALRYEIPVVCRLRTKLKNFFRIIPGIDLKIVPVRDVGYFLLVPVDNLWKT